ncbi:MAG: FimV/HubP family polar landmark protein [Gallionella sp.]
MSKSLLKTLSVSVCLAWSSLSFAVGLGGINVTSGLGERLKADIDLVAVNKAEKSSLVARLASPDTYKNAGLEYPYNNKFKFDVASRANGDPYLNVSTAQPVNDPFVVVMVELNWASGRLVREYTFLLDPPGYVADQPAPANVETVAPVAQNVAEPAVIELDAPAEVESIEAVVAEPVAPAPELAAEPVPVATKPMPEKIAPFAKFDIAPKQSAPAKPKAAAASADSYKVQRGDTLAKIASEDMPSGVSLERSLVALYRANANQFDGQNMNRLSVGKTLRLPTDQEIKSVTQADAITEIRAQAEDWNAYRQQLAGAATESVQPKSTQQVATGKINSSIADKAPVAKETAKEVLKLSKGEVPGDKASSAAGGKSATAIEQKNAAKEEEIAKAKALKEGQARAVALEKNLKDMEKLAQLKIEAAALAKKAEPIVNEPPTLAASAAAAVQAAKAMPKAKIKEVKPELSLLDTVLSNPTYLAAGGAGLAGLLGLGWFAARRRKSPAFVDEVDAPEFGGKVDFGSVTGKLASPVAPSPETGDFRQNVTEQPQVTTQADEVDPISEADLFLNFGRDTQAEDILKEALITTPSNSKIHLKLLEIYAKRKDTAAFENITRQLQGLGDEAAFKQAANMGRSIDSRNALYAGGIAIEDASSATMQAPVFATKVAEEEARAPVEVDFDLGAEPTGKFVASPERDFLAESQMTKSMPAASASDATDAPNLDQMIFDVTGSHPTLQMGKVSDPEIKPDVAKIEEMEFILDFPDEPKPKFGLDISSSTDKDFPSIDLNLDEQPVVKLSDSSAQDENWQEVATKLDLAKAYQEMGDESGAKEILQEVLREGDEGQRQAAQDIINLLAA